ncbi:hypothetical protein IFM89_017489 [Coptis chinensis]|uniref:RING-type domain-containing protein n=1 Tax=Coptis chinensis TaxID=261450 RepID=A0A835LS39_9MAGN|nr:hypothetical protein IFM89_017489 [Coptis chinensis]
MEVLFNQLAKSSPSCRDSLKVLEADIHHANTLAAAIPRAKGGACIWRWKDKKHIISWKGSDYWRVLWFVNYQTLLKSFWYFSHVGLLASVLTTNFENKIAAVILPSLEQLQGTEMDVTQEKNQRRVEFGRKGIEERKKLFDMDWEREDECGICMELCAKMVLPNCCHSMCINCYRDWNTRSESCPFCRGSLKRVSSSDLWVLTNSGDFLDSETVSKEDLSRFYLYIDKLPRDIPDALFLVYYEYLI